ncbi:GDSL esterase/lipase At5g08460-like [Rosa rugosa]|uniref:GDSL esterase/lipase At5g08460-like n=1 Tax=Rosa rugosa TaxID=74645 RepID=UPI002B4102FF|nr:GDSL esterase/lipase At5g08460-like [Rosa rugosa]
MVMINLLLSFLCIFTTTALSQPTSAPPYSQEPIDAATLISPPPPSISATPPPDSIPPKTPLVPGLFVIGDSSVDSGTNNFLGTLTRADCLPYGRYFDTHEPTGWFYNGRIPIDYIALQLGLPFVPIFLRQTGRVEDMLHGLNFASAAVGIIFTSGSELVCLTLLFSR